MRAVKLGRGISSATVALALSGLAMTASGGSEAGEETTRHEEAKSMSEAEVYRHAILKHRQLADAWRERSAGTEELLRAASELRNDLERLRRLAEGDAVAAAAQAKTARVEPSGPVTSSAEPSSAPAIEARERATDRWMTVSPPEAVPPEETLEGVSNDWIRQSCRQAGAQLAVLETLWRGESSDRAAVDAGLAGLEATLRALAHPPRPSEPVEPEKR